MFQWLRQLGRLLAGSLVLTLAASVPAGYALALTKFRGRKLLLTVTLVVMIMPSAALVLPIFLELNLFGLIGTVWSIILPFSFYPFGVYLVYIYFATSLPRDLLEAARIDGCNEWQVFRRIAMPLAKPVIALVAFFSFVGNWNNFFLPYLVLPNSDQFPIQVGLNQLLSSTPSFNPVAGAGLNITSPELALAIIIAILPVLVLFLFSQRALVSGHARRIHQGIGPRVPVLAVTAHWRPRDRASPPGHRGVGARGLRTRLGPLGPALCLPGWGVMIRDGGHSAFCQDFLAKRYNFLLLLKAGPQVYRLPSFIRGHRRCLASRTYGEVRRVRHKRMAPRRRKRLLIGALALLLVLTGAGITGAWAYGRSLNGNLARTDAFAGLPASARPTQAVTGAMNILLLGSDSRDPDNTTDSRTDTIMVLHLDADHQHAYVISIPRDTWVYVPASADHQHGDTMAKINSAYAWGGTPLTVQTVETFTGVHIDHVALVDFAGFEQVTDALGGVDMNIEKTITSIHAPYRTFTKGTQHLTGAEALDYVRQRYQFADGDFSRERHQREFLAGAAGQGGEWRHAGQPGQARRVPAGGHQVGHRGQ